MRAPDPNAAGDDNYTPPPALAHINLGAYLFDPPGANDGDVYYNTNANSLRVYDRSLASWIQVSGAITGTTAPTTIPTYLGQTYLDSTNKINYIATGTTATTDWNGIPFLSTANTFTAAQTITPSSGTALSITQASGAIGLRLQNNATTGNFIEGFASDNTTSQFRIRGIAGQIGTGSLITGTLFAANLDILGGTNIGAVIRGSSSQTADLQQWQATGGTVLGGSNAVGQNYTGSTSTINGSTASINQTIATAAVSVQYQTTAAHSYGVGDLVTITGLTTAQGQPATNPVVITAVTSTTFTATVTSGTTGTYTGLTATATVPAQSSITARSAGTKGLVVRGAASQVNNLQEWQANDASILGTFGPDGRLTLSPSASGVGQVIKVNGADALRIRNNADTSTIANIDSSGNIWGNIVRGGSSALDIGGIVSGLGYSTGAVKAAVFRGGSSGGVGTQYTDLMQFQTGATGNAALGGINAVGQFYNGSTLPTSFATGGTIQSIATGANPLITTGSAHTLSVGDLVTLAGTTGGTYNGTFIVLSTPLTTTFTIATSLTTGQAGTGGTITAPAQASITARSTGTIGLTVSPISSSSAEVARFYHGNGSTYSGFDAAARFFVRTSGITHGTPSFAVNTASDTAIGAVIRGNSATQSADLQQWQTSAAAVGTRVVAGGGIIAVEPIVTSTAGAGTTTTLDCSTGTTFTVTFGAGNVTGFLFTNLPAAGSVTVTLILKQDGTGSRTVTWSGTQVNGSATNATPKWAGGTAPTLTTTASAVDIVTLVINRTGGSTDNVYGFLAGKAFA